MECERDRAIMSERERKENALRRQNRECYKVCFESAYNFEASVIAFYASHTASHFTYFIFVEVFFLIIFPSFFSLFIQHL